MTLLSYDIRAGVAGLTTALVLARKGYQVTVVSQHMPGDLSIDYTSPWAVNSDFLLYLITGSKLAINCAIVFPPPFKLSLIVS